jgi:hypothetical protein
MTPQRRTRWRPALYTPLIVVGAVLAILTPAASATDYTWSGEGLETAAFWSNGANWVGDGAPASSSSVGTLTFPSLTSPDCPPFTMTEACYGAANDLTDLSVNELQIDDTLGYALSDNGFTLGGGGLKLTTEQNESQQPIAHIFLPLTLGASQTWEASGAHNTYQTLEVTKALSGESSALAVNLNEAQLTLGELGPRGTPVIPDDEVGDVTVTGPATGNVTLKGSEAVTVEGDLELNADLNATDGNSLSLHNVQFTTKRNTGPIDATDSRLRISGSGIGALNLTGSLLQLEGPIQVPSASFDSTSLIESTIDNRGTTVGADYDPIMASGPVDLGGAALELKASIQPTLQTGECPAPTKGATYTLVSTTGSLTGTFADAANGSTAMETECLTVGTHGEVLKDESYPFRIAYNTGSEPQTVTVTALGSVPVNTIAPGISGTTTEGQTLTDVAGTWEGSPTSYTYQWQRCDALGANCQAISGATGQSYTLTAADVGSEIRVQETGVNGEGAGSSAVSDPTRAVSAASGGSGGGGTGGGTGGGNTGPATSTGASAGTSTGTTSLPGSLAIISSAQISSLLGQQLTPSGNAAKISSLLKSGGLTISLTALEAGAAVIDWYEVPAGAKLAKHAAAKPVLVASGQVSFPAAGTGKLKLRLTAAGKRLLKKAKQLKLTAKGTFTPTGKAATVTTKTFSLKGK